MLPFLEYFCCAQAKQCFQFACTGVKALGSKLLSQCLHCLYFDFMTFLFPPLCSGWTSFFLSSVCVRSEEEGIRGLHRPSGRNCVWKPVDPQRFTLQGQLPLPRLTLLLPHSSQCPQFCLSCKIMLKEKGLCHPETLNYYLGQLRWSPAVSFTGWGVLSPNTGELSGIKFSLIQSFPSTSST